APKHRLQPTSAAGDVRVLLEVLPAPQPTRLKRLPLVARQAIVPAHAPIRRPETLVRFHRTVVPTNIPLGSTRPAAQVFQASDPPGRRVAHYRTEPAGLPCATPHPDSRVHAIQHPSARPQSTCDRLLRPCEGGREAG